MTKTRPGADRITKQQLQAQAVAAERAMHAHIPGCATCHKAGNDMRMRCGIWWQLAIRAHGARRKLRQYGKPETANVNPLPGME